MNRQDELWKAIIEEFFVEFLELFYPTLIPQIDFTKEFDFLDKDLPKLFPKAEEIARKADRIVKVPLIGGGSQWLIIHIEIQGYKDPKFARRMFTYYYRLADRFDIPIAAMVIYSDNNKKNRVNKYETSCFNTQLLYKFDTYVIVDHTTEEYEAMDNPFAIIFQTALTGILGNKKDEELLELKIQLFRKLLTKGYKKEQIQRLATFIKEYVRFSKSDFYHKFDKRSEELSKNRKSMGIIETVIRYRSEEAVAQAKEQGIEKGIEKGHQLAAQKKAFFETFNNKIQIIIRGKEIKLTEEAIVTIAATNKLFVNEFLKLVNTAPKQKRFLNKMTQIKDKNSPKYTIEQLKIDLIQLLLTFKFSEKVISKELKCAIGLVKKIIKISQKK